MIDEPFAILAYALIVILLIQIIVLLQNIDANTRWRK